ncbi:MAG: bifunctional riboflavin kinase/FAD synthetase [Lachnospiraceae bacterium]|nr:bifunctional riboflavin kinase/FAD synthetase [Lachnospiraceae bacterium]
MEYISGIDSFYSMRKTAVTLGKFDGLHLGHQLLINQVKECSSQDIDSVVFAFDMHEKSLLTEKEQFQHLNGLVDVLIRCPFTREIREMEAETFIERVLKKRLKASHIVVGTDFHFGYRAGGNVDMLRDYAKKYDYTLHVIEKVKYGQREISSSYIKEALLAGKMELANDLLGYGYEVSGVVEYGRQLAGKLGFPTINLLPPEGKFLPQSGVYYSKIEVDGRNYDGICNLGVKPTITNEERLLAEVHVFDFDGDVYGKKVKIGLISFVRTEKKFASIEDLKAQVDEDIISVRRKAICLMKKKNELSKNLYRGDRLP